MYLLWDSIHRQTQPYGMPNVQKGKTRVERPQPHLGNPPPRPGSTTTEPPTS